MNITISNETIALIVLVLLWDLVWRGLGLWRAGRQGDKVWFVIILFVNSVGLIPILYLLLTKKKGE